MTDEGHVETDIALEKIEKRLKKAYSEAEKGAEEKFNRYMADFARKDEKHRADVAAGKWTKEQYDGWRKNQLLSSRQLKEVRDTLATDLHNVDKIAMSIVRDHQKDVYAINHNYGTFQVERDAMVDTSYSLYDHDTVERLMREQPELLPPPSPKRQREIDALDIKWNKEHLNSSFTASILRGDSIPEMARAISAVAQMDRNAAVRNARTMTTGAESAGRIDSYRRAQRMGIELNQEWVATLDGRTRDSHRAIDGEKIKVGSKFSNGCRYPGDPQARPEEVYNCRCRMIAVVDGIDPMAFNKTDTLRRKLDNKDIPYEEWKRGHQKKAQKASNISDILSMKQFDSYTPSQKKTFKTILEGMDDGQRELYSWMAQYQGNNDYVKKNAGWYSPAKHKVEMDINSIGWEKAVGETDATGAWKTKFHEELHQLDHVLGMASGNKFADITCAEGNLLQDKGKYGDRLATAIRQDVVDYCNKVIDAINKSNEGSLTYTPEKGFVEFKPMKHLENLNRIPRYLQDYIWPYMENDLNTTEKQARASAFTDAIGLATKGRLDAYSHGFWGHKATYQRERGINGATSECFAEIGSHILRHDEKSLEFLRQYMPKSVAEYEKVLKEVEEDARNAGKVDYR